MLGKLVHFREEAAMANTSKHFKRPFRYVNHRYVNHLEIKYHVTSQLCKILTILVHHLFPYSNPLYIFHRFSPTNTYIHRFKWKET